MEEVVLVAIGDYHEEGWQSRPSEAIYVEAERGAQRNGKKVVRVPEQRTNSSYCTFGPGGPILIKLLLFPKL